MRLTQGQVLGFVFMNREALGNALREAKVEAELERGPTDGISVVQTAMGISKSVCKFFELLGYRPGERVLTLELMEMEEKLYVADAVVLVDFDEVRRETERQRARAVLPSPPSSQQPVTELSSGSSKAPVYAGKRKRTAEHVQPRGGGPRAIKAARKTAQSTGVP